MARPGSAVGGLVVRGKLWLTFCALRKAECTVGLGGAAFVALPWTRLWTRPGLCIRHTAAVGSRHYLGPLGPLEIFHLHFIFMEEFPAQTFPAVAQGCSQICKAETSHPSSCRQAPVSGAHTDSAQPPGRTRPERVPVWHPQISHGDSSTRLRSVLWVLTVGVWQEQGTASFVSGGDLSGTVLPFRRGYGAMKSYRLWKLVAFCSFLTLGHLFKPIRGCRM